MEQLQQREWYELQSRTWQLLRRREHIRISKHRPLLQYLVMPSFTDTWCIDIVRTGETLCAYRTAWRMTRDINAFTTAIERLKHPRPFVPTIASTPLDIDRDSLATLLAHLAEIRIPLQKTSNAICLDGVSIELQIGDGLTGVMLQWHNDLPEEWPAELGALVCELNEMEICHAAQASEPTDEREPE